jgi:hypothetical protein
MNHASIWMAVKMSGFLSASLVAGLFGQQGQNSLRLPFGNAARAGSAGEAVVAFRRVTKAGEEEKGLAREKKDPITLTSLAQFRQALDAAPNIDKALSDPRVLKVLMPALGLPDQIGRIAVDCHQQWLAHNAGVQNWVCKSGYWH